MWWLLFKIFSRRSSYWKRFIWELRWQKTDWIHGLRFQLNIKSLNVEILMKPSIWPWAKNLEKFLFVINAIKKNLTEKYEKIDTINFNPFLKSVRGGGGGRQNFVWSRSGKGLEPALVLRKFYCNIRSTENFFVKTSRIWTSSKRWSRSTSKVTGTKGVALIRSRNCLMCASHRYFSSSFGCYAAFSYITLSLITLLPPWIALFPLISA